MPKYAIEYIAQDRLTLHFIEEDEYKRLFLAVLIDHSQLSIEEKYHILLENYKELEEEILRFSIGLTIYTPDVWLELENARLQFNRRVLNFLSSARMYLDHVPSLLKKACRMPKQINDNFKKILSTHYNTTLGFRVCEALRNYTQHRDLPVHRLEYGFRREADDPKGLIIQNTGLSLNLSPLETDRTFKKSTLIELKALGDNYDLKHFLREYMACLGDVHINLRKNLSEDSNWAINEIKLIRSKIFSLPDSKPNADISLVIVEDNKKYRRTAALVVYRFERRIKLEKFSARAPKMLSLQISSE